MTSFSAGEFYTDFITEDQKFDNCEEFHGSARHTFLNTAHIPMHTYLALLLPACCKLLT